MEKPGTMNSHDAARVAVEKFGAPADIGSYVWVQAGSAPRSVPLAHVESGPHGTLRVGWDSDLRFALYSWEPRTPSDS